jgi:hypothetical protein
MIDNPGDGTIFRIIFVDRHCLFHLLPLLGRSHSFPLQSFQSHPSSSHRSPFSVSQFLSVSVPFTVSTQFSRSQGFTGLKSLFSVSVSADSDGGFPFSAASDLLKGVAAGVGSVIGFVG